MPGPVGGISHIFHSSKAGKSRKFLHKKHGDGFEAPRNSLDISIDTSKGYRYITEDIPVKQQHSSKMNHFPNGTPMKNLIHGEISRRTSQNQVAPSVVARLIGIDSIPSERNPRIRAKEHEIDRLRKVMEINKAMKSRSSGLYTSLSSTSSRQTKQSFLLSGNGRDPNTERRRKPQPRKHPQEELLQKFKKEFEEWQASKLWERSRPLGEGKNYRTVGQENVDKEKMTKHLDTEKNLAEKKPTESKEPVSPAKNKIDTQESSLQSHREFNKQCQFISKNKMTMKLGARTNDLEHFPVTKVDRKHERSCSPTRIVILKPDFDRNDGNEEPLATSSDKFGKECSMEDFLQEVKERLRNEVQGKYAGSSVKARGSGMRNTSFSERPTDPKQIARDIAKQIRESVTKDMGTSLMRSESTRSIKSDIQINTPDSPEFIRRDTRKFLSEKSKNVLRNEIVLEKPLIIHGGTSAYSLIKEKARPKLMSDFSKKGKNVDYWEDKKAVTESIPRHKKEKVVALDADSASQWNLIRSFSAPVTSTAFGKLLLEDQHITGAQIRRKQEASEHNFSEIRKRRNGSFNLKGRVSNLKQNFNLKGKLFGKKTQMVKEPTAGGFNSVKEMPAAPSFVTNSGITQENPTEVPPSPASVSSSSPDEFCRQDNPSPISPLEVMEYHTSTCVSEELSSNAPEPHLSEQVDHGRSEMAIEEQLHKQETVGMESEDAACLQDVLVTAGFYEDRPSDQANSRLDALTRPMAHQVFEEVEEVYAKYGKVDIESSIIHNDNITIGHRLLFDLVNEALQCVLGPKISCSMFRLRILGSAASTRGKSLLDDLWNKIQLYLNPSLDDSDTLNSRVVLDLKMTTWPTILYEDIDIVGRRIERIILLDLIDGIVRDMCFQKP